MKLSKLSLKEAKEVYDAYLTLDFPRFERKPFSAIEKMFQKDQYISAESCI